MGNMNKLNERIQKCNKCALCAYEFNKKDITKGYGKLYGWYGGENAKVMFVGMNPSYNRFENLEYAFGGKNFKEGTGIEFTGILKKVNALEKCYVTNLCKCSSHSNSIKQEWVDECSNWLIEEIKLVKPELIITLGRKVDECIKNNKCLIDFLISYNIRTENIFHPNYVISYNRNLMESYEKQIKEIVNGKI